MKMNRRNYLNLTSAAIFALCASPVLAEDKPVETLITNVSIFDGTNEALITGQDVVISDNEISKIIAEGSDKAAYDTVIDGKGGFLTPGLIDVHWHITMGTTEDEYLNGSLGYVMVHSAKEAEEQLLRGVTTVRDAGGNSFGLKKAIDTGVVPGPRIYPSGALLSQYSGHADFRPSRPTSLPKEWGGQIPSYEQDGHMLMINGVDQALAGVRQQLFLGATQIKIAVTGGVSSFTDPLYVKEFNDEELATIVGAAADYGTYVMAHGFHPDGVARALENGVTSIEHGGSLDEATVKLMADKGAVFVPNLEVMAQLTPLYTDPVRKAKLEESKAGMADAIKFAIKHKVLMGVGTDLLFSAAGRKDQLKELGLRKDYFTSPEIMVQATGNGGKIVGLSGKRNPYGKLGVIEEGAMADILIYAKNPLEDVSVVEDYEANLMVIIKDGKVYKNGL